MAEKNEKIQKQEPNVTVSITSGSWPIGLLKEWEADCIKNYGNCRWMKMWNDHLIAKQATAFAEILKDEIEVLKLRLDKLERKKKRNLMK